MTIDPVLYRGKPENGRIPKEARCYELLDALGMEYCRADHDFADTIDACHEVEKVLGCEICKNLLLTNRQMTEVYLLLKYEPVFHGAGTSAACVLLNHNATAFLNRKALPAKVLRREKSST